jgi:YHYH protein
MTMRRSCCRTVVVGGLAIVGILCGPAAAGTRTAAFGASPSPVNPVAIPLGDGNLSTTPKVGFVDSCMTRFPTTGGAQAVGPWINTTAKTWDSVTKVNVQGSVAWPTASASITRAGAKRTIKTNDLPTNHTTGTFPVASSDPAAAYDRNPNHIAAQSITWSVPSNPTAASKPSCTNGGPIGVLNDGVLVYNALDGEGRDAAAHEILDSCGGHPDMSSTYHHHDIPSCILDKATGPSTLVGYTADGYGIYVERDAQGALLTNASLDGCHGRTSPVVWNGKKKAIYHYDATLEYPYTVGCYHGTPTKLPQTGGGGSSGPAGPGGQAGGSAPPGPSGPSGTP